MQTDMLHFMHVRSLHTKIFTGTLSSVSTVTGLANALVRTFGWSAFSVLVAVVRASGTR